MATPWSWCPGAPFQSTEVAKASRTWSRKLWGGEMVFAHAALLEPGRGDGVISAVFEVPSGLHLEHQHTRLALRNLRFTHPSIASKVVWPEVPDPTQARFVYESPVSEEEVTSWLDETTSIVRTGETIGVEAALTALRAEFGRVDFDRTEDQLRQYHILPSPDKPQVHGVAFYLRHTLFDAGAAWGILNYWLKEVAQLVSRSPKDAELQLQWGAEVTRLARPVSDRTNNSWSPDDMHGEWPLVKRMHKVLERPSSSFGIPIPHLEAPLTDTAWKVVDFSEATTKDLAQAAKQHGVKMFALQLATILVACLRINPPTGEGEHRVTLPYNPINLRPWLSTNGPAEIVSALGFNALDAADLLRFKPSKGDKEMLEAVWTLSKEIQAQINEQNAWHGDVARTAPIVMKTLAEAIFMNPPPSHPLRIFGITNFGVLDSMLSPTYTVPGISKPLKVIQADLNNLMFHLPQSLLPVLLQAWTWRGVLRWCFSYSPAHMGKNAGEHEEGPTLAKVIAEMKSITMLLAKDVQQQARL